MDGKDSAWRAYEEVASHLLNEIAGFFGLERIELRRTVPGHRTGSAWRLDAIGFTQDGDAFVIIECRRHTEARISQEAVGALAFRISDTGASGAIVVSPLGLQEGAERVAAATDVVSVVLDENSTTTDYLLRFLNRVWAGVGDSGHGTDTFRVQKR